MVAGSDIGDFLLGLPNAPALQVPLFPAIEAVDFSAEEVVAPVTAAYASYAQQQRDAGAYLEGCGHPHTFPKTSNGTVVVPEHPYPFAARYARIPLRIDATTFTAGILPIFIAQSAANCALCLAFIHVICPSLFMTCWGIVSVWGANGDV